jgi:DNA modification methylase
MNKILFGDCRETLRHLAADGVKAQMCVTSPPYFGLRSYGGGKLEIGQEQTPEQYIANMVEVFRCVRNVLADDGVLWLNIGDTYGKGKQLLGIPWRVALALQADGWILRQDIVWEKSNAMPESVTDRCTKSHEYLFLLAKSPRYFYDHAAIKEPAIKGAAGSSFNKGKTATHQLGRSSSAERVEDGMRNRRSVWTVSTKPYAGAHFATFPSDLIAPCILAGSRPGDIVLDPFMGSGTTAAVAILHGRQYLGCELNETYKPLQDARIAAALPVAANEEMQQRIDSA